MSLASDVFGVYQKGSLAILLLIEIDNFPNNLDTLHIV